MTALAQAQVPRIGVHRFGLRQHSSATRQRRDWLIWVMLSALYGFLTHKSPTVAAA